MNMCFITAHVLNYKMLPKGKYKKTARCLNILFFVSLCFPESFKTHIGRSSDSSFVFKPSRC